MVILTLESDIIDIWETGCFPLCLLKMATHCESFSRRMCPAPKSCLLTGSGKQMFAVTHLWMLGASLPRGRAWVLTTLAAVNCHPQRSHWWLWRLFVCGMKGIPSVFRWCRLELNWKERQWCHQVPRAILNCAWYSCLGNALGSAHLLSLQPKPSALSSQALFYKTLSCSRWEWVCRLSITWNEGQRRCFSPQTGLRAYSGSWNVGR